MHVQYDTNLSFSHVKSKTILVDKTTDFAGHVKLDSLTPDTLYHYRTWFTSSGNNSNKESSLTSTTRSDCMIGSFRTAPNHLTSTSSNSNRPISFVIGGDLGGQSYCRRIGIGYPIFSIMQALSPDFFIFDGDQIYGDSACFANGPSNVTGWRNIEGNFLSATDNRVNWSNQTQLEDIYNKHWEYNRADPHLQGFFAKYIHVFSGRRP